MCSIIGYTGIKDAAPILVRSLEKMEYRGYDSVGIATKNGDIIDVKKGIGKVSEVSQTLQLDEMSGTIGIGHTRWATHGKVTKENAHPHYSNSGKIAIVHNGIIENFQELKDQLALDGFSFQSDTDSEIIANLIQQKFEETGNFKETIIETISKLKGHYSFMVIFEDGTLAAARLREPLVIGVEKDGYYISSDVLGFIEKTDNAIYIDNENFVVINNLDLKIFDFNGISIKPNITKVSKDQNIFFH